MKQEADKYYFLRHQYVVSSGSDKGPPTLALRAASRGQAVGQHTWAPAARANYSEML